MSSMGFFFLFSFFFSFPNFCPFIPTLFLFHVKTTVYVKVGERDDPECNICAFLDHSLILFGCGSSVCSHLCRISQTDHIPWSSFQPLESSLLPDPGLTIPDPAKSQSSPDRRYLTSQKSCQDEVNYQDFTLSASFSTALRVVKLDLFRCWNFSGKFSVRQRETCPLLQVWVVLGAASP